MSLQVIHTSSSSSSSEDAWIQRHCLGAPYGQRLPKLKEVEREKGSLNNFMGETQTQTPQSYGGGSQDPLIHRL